MILVTGGAGYIGSHCVLDLLKHGYDVAILDNLSTGHIETVNALKNLDYKGKLVDFINADLRNIEDVAKAFKKHKFSAVIHFAAFSIVSESVLNPQKYYRNNVVGSLNLLDAMLKYDVKNIVFSSSAAVYGEPERIPTKEEDRLNPINPYGKTKLNIEHAICDYSRAYDFNYIIFRYFNVFGASEDCVTGEWHQNETHLVPNIIKSAISDNKTFELYGDDYPTPDGTCVRDYIDVEELAAAHRLAYERLLKGGSSHIINLGTKSGQSVKGIFGACEKVLGKKIPLKICPRRASDPAKLVADVEKADKILGWRASAELEKSINAAYKWELKLKNIEGIKEEMHR